MTTTIHTIRQDQVFGLMVEAAAAGDTEQVAICERALEDDHAALALCVEAINAAENMAAE